MVWGQKSFLSGSKYVGDMANGRRHGKGVKTWPNGDKYEGEWVNDKKEGKGVFECHDGSRYDGDWVANLKHGKGRCTFVNGDVYEGEWELDVASGQGIFTRPNGNRFEGSYRNDKSNGYGVFYFSNGDRYEGEWRDGLKTGSGAVIWSDGHKFEGTFMHDCPVSGELTELDGSVYSVVYDGRTTFGRGAEPQSKTLILSGERSSKTASSKPPRKNSDDSSDSSSISRKIPPSVPSLPATKRAGDDEWDPAAERRSQALEAKLNRSADAWEEMMNRVGLEMEPAGSGSVKSSGGGTKGKSAPSSSWYNAELECPLSHEMMFDPVICADGVTYERRCIARWLETHDISPSTGMPLSIKALAPNEPMRQKVHRWWRGRSWEIDESLLSIGQGQLGRGAWGQVREGTLARGAGSGAGRVDVAVKGWPQADSEMEARLFEQEFRVLKRLGGCSHICPMYGAVRKGGRRYIVLKRCRQTLTDYLLASPGRRLPAERVVALGLELFEALAQAHGRGVVIQDVKPSNILLDDKGGMLMLCDMGVAITLEGSVRAVMPKELCGTPNYMSPEMFDPARFGGVGRPCDVWGAACVLIEAVSGRIPWDGMGQGAVSQAVVDRREKPAVPAGIPGELSSLISNCLCHDPGQRLTADEAVERLREMVQDAADSSSLAAPGAASPAPTAPSIPSSALPPRPPFPPPAHAAPPPATAASVDLLSLLGNDPWAGSAPAPAPPAAVPQPPPKSDLLLQELWGGPAAASAAAPPPLPAHPPPRPPGPPPRAAPPPPTAGNLIDF